MTAHGRVARVGILISGRGSNMVALIRAMRGDFPARAVIVLADNGDAPGLARARELGVLAAAVARADFDARAAFERELATRLDAARVDVVCLAGFMRILGPPFVARFRGRMLNIHPSLLPKYPGLDTHQRALDAGDREAGCTVHEVTEAVDGGRILGQARVPIRAGDDAATLAARVLKEEHRLYPAMLRQYLEAISAG